ncbi:OsmC family protein [Caenimonas sp. SL110]|uniref:OsmC family protein n=1 Tax=Caenimonas sp. SL110 TaxID=1450524 RepID=UPI0006545A28|nr:OsmC family protein [Caenimonas sp. SL110]
MNTQANIRESLIRARETLERKPSAALKEDSVAVAVWSGNLSTQLQHPSVTQLSTEMPTTLGGAGGAAPGWYFRAGVASCMVTSIAMEAAVQGIALTRLEVQAHSESDARGMLGTEGVLAGPLRFWLKVAIESPGTSEAQLRALVALAASRSPLSQGLQRGLPIELEVDLQPQAAPVA